MNKLTNFMDLKKRLIVSLATVIAVAALIIFANVAIVQIVLVLIIAALSIVGLWEFTNMMKVKEVHLPWPLLSAGAFIWLILLYISLYDKKFYFLPALALVILSFLIFCRYFNKIENSIAHISNSFFGFLYIVIPLGMILKILYPYSAQDGRIWLAYLICVTKSSDIGAYFIGKMFGKRPLATILSPAKTVEGAVGGLISALFISVVFYFLGLILPEGMFAINIYQAIVIGVIVGAIGQIGDLAESLIKRDVNIKDSNSLPGFGGVLDLLDSLLFTIPVIYLVMKIL